MVDGKITSFEDLVAWQKSQDLAVAMYTYTKLFPDEEKFALTSQIRRAASSVSANIAEGFGRRSHKDKLHFYAMSYGSLLEVKNFIYLSYRLGYLTDEVKVTALAEAVSCQKLINALMKSIHEKK